MSRAPHLSTYRHGFSARHRFGSAYGERPRQDHEAEDQARPKALHDAPLEIGLARPGPTNIRGLTVHLDPTRSGAQGAGYCYSCFQNPRLFGQ